MIPRPLLFLAGAGAGAYAVVKARRVAESFTVDGLRDRASVTMLFNVLGPRSRPPPVR